MKKKILLALFISAAMCMTACGKVEEESSSNASSAAVSATTENSQTETSETNSADTADGVQPETVSADSSEDTMPVDPILMDSCEGGYISSDNEYACLMSGTDANAAVWAEIPDGTQINFYSFDRDWCVVSYQGYVGYVEAKYISRLDDFDADFDESSLDSFSGEWQYERCCISINKNETDYAVEIHWADSAAEENVWNYTCTLSEDNTRLECKGGGTLVHVVTDEDSTETRTEIYNDGTADFTKKGGTLFWQEGKEDIARQLGFEKIG